MNFFRKINILLNRLLMLLGLRRGQGYWGVVYDSQSKQPLDPVIVKLIEVQWGKVMATCITDLNGRYGFLAPPGKYKILVKKSNYVFPTRLATGSRDSLFSNIYRGEFFTLEGEADVIPFNIPMDPVSSDWNQEAKKHLTNLFPFFETFLLRVVAILFWFVLVLAAIDFFAARSNFSAGVLVFYAAIFALAFLLPRNRLWGRVLDATTKSPIAGAEITLSHKLVLEVIVAKALVSEDGKFFLRAEPGKYLLRLTKESEKKQTRILKSFYCRVGSEGLINEDILV